MGFYHLIYNCFVFFLLCLVYRIIQILTLNGTVSWNSNGIHAIGIAEFFLLRKSSTGHTCLLIELVEEILEGDGSQCTAFTAHIYMLLCLDRLMKSVGIAAARHDTSCKLIYDQYLIVLYHVILISEHQVIGAQSQNDIVLDLQIFRICKVINVEIFLYLFHTLLRKVYYLILLINYEIAGLLNLLTHNGINLGKFLGNRSALQLTGQYIADLIKLCGFSALSGNDQRGSRLVDQHRVHLIDNTVVQIAEHQLLLVNGHIVTKVVKSQLVICHIGNVAGVCLLALGAVHVI